MIDPGDMYQALQEHGISFFTGVPDSLLKHFCACVTDRTPKSDHVIAANEGGAVALAAGYYLSTGRAALVYMQNSGLGNAVNPLLSLADKEVYSIPTLLMIGWRGEPGVSDEPQHVKQGRVTLDLLDRMEVPYEVIGPGSDWRTALVKLMQAMTREQGPVALVVRKGTFSPYDSRIDSKEEPILSREEAIRLIVEHLEPEDVVVSTTGMASRELFEIREARGEGHRQDFLTVGSMGHASQIALGIALRQPGRRVVCLDGDGAVIMHGGNLAIIGHTSPAKFYHILLNNGAHDSVGGQPTAAETVDFPKLALASGYRSASSAQNEDEVVESLRAFRRKAGPSFLEIKVRKGARKDLGRPTTTPLENRDALMKRLMG